MQNDSPQFVVNQYLSELRNPNTALSSQFVSHLSHQATTLFFEHFRIHKKPLREAIELLCEINRLPDKALAHIGVEAIFPQLIEKLNDAFDPTFCDLYDRLFAQVISFYRQLPEGHLLDETLNYFGLTHETALLARKRALTTSNYFLAHSRPLKKILFLSRITVGADVAITSVLISHLKQLYPSAEIIIIGTSNLAQLYEGEGQIRIKPIDYGRNANLLSRLLSWREVVVAVQDETSDLNAEEFCIFDPDSRLTQLGLLPLLTPLLDHQNYFYFESRRFSRPGYEKLGQLTSQWVNDLTCQVKDSYPFISLSPRHKAIGSELAGYLRSASNSSVICLSFGVGGNDAKRVSERFEIELVNKLSQHHLLFLDCGATAKENDLVERILCFLNASGIAVLCLNELTYSTRNYTPSQPPQLIAWKGGIGSFAALIANSDWYVGYDSSGQHLAAALAIPVHTIFVNPNSASFAQRWQPHSKAKTNVSLIDASSNLSEERIINNILQDIRFLP